MELSDSPIGPNVTRFNVETVDGCTEFPSYNGFFSTNANKKSVWTAFNKIYEYVKENKAVLFHCSQGKDRTGCLAYILLGMIGVSETDARRDYGFTYYSDADDEICMSTASNKAGYAGLNSYIYNKLPSGDTFQDRCKAYMISCGTLAGDSEAKSKVNEFVSIMTEDVEVF